jgi:hypothetical protein
MSDETITQVDTDLENTSNETDDYPPTDDSQSTTVDDTTPGDPEDSNDPGQTAEPDPEYLHKILTGTEALSTLGEAVAIFANAESALLMFEATGGIATILSMIANIIDAVNTPERICGYQGLVYGLMYTALGMGDPVQNPGWPGKEAAPEGAEYFADGLATAKSRLSTGQDGVKSKNLLLLAVARDGAKKVVNQLWQAAVADNDHLLKNFTVEWPKIGPNG